MMSPTQIEELYKKFSHDLGQWIHEDIISIDLSFLHNHNLLHSIQEEKGDPEDLTQYFHVIENLEKVTLFNEQFVVWIVPKNDDPQPTTFVLITLNQENISHLEVVFTAQGVYNSPRYVLKVLQYFLLDMVETEATLTSFKKNL